MGRKLHLSESFKEQDFLKIMRKMKHGRNRIRLLAMHHIQLGKSLAVVSSIVKVHWSTVQGWVKRYNALGFEGLYEGKRSGAPRKIADISEQFIITKIATLSQAKTGGYITGKEMRQELIDKYGIQCCLKTIYNTLHRLNFSWITSRSIHPKSNLEIQDQYKKALRLC
jgi:transposase